MTKSISDIIEECARITSEQKNSNDISSFASALFIMCGLALISIIALYIKEGFSNKLLIFLSIVLVMLFLHRMRIGQTSKKVEELAVDKSGSEDVSKDLAYLQAGLDMKFARIKGVKWFFIIVFPIYLLVLQQFLKGIIETNFSPWTAPLLFVVSYLVWTWFFRSDINKIAELKTRVNFLQARTKAIAKS